ncbi:MAG: heavy metal translocating P-type ATPase [Rudaea sp.]
MRDDPAAARTVASARSACFHCGDENPAQTPWRATIDGVDASFCCAGCLAVAQTIRAAGLSAFYARREGASPRSDVAAGDAERTSEAAAAEGLIVDAGGGLREVALLVDGMRCGACVWLLETWLARQPGVASVAVNFATRRARVRFDVGSADLRAILDAFSRVGYRAYPYDPARREALVRRESRTLLLRTALALLGMMQVMMFAVPAYLSADGVAPEYRRLLDWASLALALPVVGYCAAPFFAGAWRDLRTGRPGMDVPIALGVGAAFLASAFATVSGEGAVYFDSVTMFVALVLAARWLELRMRERAGDALEATARDLPATAERLDGYPERRVTCTVAATRLVRGDVVRVPAGAIVPADGVVLEGRSSVEEALLTGESWPRAKGIGERVLAGSVNRESPLTVRVDAAGEATTLAHLARLVERAAAERPQVARLAERVATVFVACLLALAAATGVAWWFLDPARALPVAIAVLVVSCPCALSLATPAALASAAGALGRRGILCVRPDALERLAGVTHVVLDKTGTVTTGHLRLGGVEPAGGVDADRCVAIAAALERGASHPLARALDDRAAGDVVARDVVATPGQGVEGTIDGLRYRFGRADWVAALGGVVPGDDALAPATRVGLAAEGRYLATFRFDDAIRPEAASLVAALRASGIGVTLLSGDRADTVGDAARAIGVADWRADASPDAKRAFVAALQGRGARVAMVGDGINDAPSLACADVSIALGSAATLTRWTADIVVLGDDLARVAFAVDAARRTFRVIRQNLAWAALYNVVAIPLAATGHLSPLAAAFGMSVSSLAVVANAWRLSRPARGDVACAPAPPPASFPIVAVAG